MRNLLSAWSEVTGRIEQARAILVLADFDGTLSPLEETPGAVVLPSEARSVLEELKSGPKSSVGVISGRKLADLEARVGVSGIWYVGNHGFELRTPTGEGRTFFAPEEAEFIRAIEQEVAKSTANIPGILLENKGPTLAVHHRRVETARVPEVERICRHVFHRNQQRLRLIQGLCVFEFRLREGFNKGTAVRLIRKESMKGPLTFYFGDDVTDDDVFRVLLGVGIGVKVGRRPSRLAPYSLRGPEEVLEALVRIRCQLNGGGAEGESSKPAKGNGE